ncbi:hypothetical protein GW17_00032191 [Ensete ventricosum]|nr:hypothetical protein GW17_00032191 [Ensete ventricosum]
MHPLRFPNRGIRAKAPCRVSRPWPGYLQGAVGCGQSPYKGRPSVGMAGCGQPAWATANGQPTKASWQCPARKGLPPMASLAASRGGGAGRRDGLPLAGWLPATKGSCCLRKGNGGGAVRVKER